MQDIQPIYYATPRKRALSFSKKRRSSSHHLGGWNKNFSLFLITCCFFPLLSGCQTQQWTQPVSGSLPWLSWLFWAFTALAALTFLVGLEQEHDSLSLSGLVLLGGALLWFGLRIFPLGWNNQAWLWILLQAALLLGFVAFAGLLLFRSLEDGFHPPAWVAFLLIFFTTLPYTRATTPPQAPLSIPPSLQALCFNKTTPPRTLSSTAKTCVRLARLTLRLQYRLQHELYPLYKDYTQRFQESWPLIQERFEKLPAAQKNEAGLARGTTLYEWRRLSQIALFRRQLEALQKTIEHTLAQSRFYLWELAQQIRLHQESLDVQKQHYLEAERSLDQLLHQKLVRWIDKKHLATLQGELVQQLKNKK